MIGCSAAKHGGWQELSGGPEGCGGIACNDVMAKDRWQKPSHYPLLWQSNSIYNAINKIIAPDNKRNLILHQMNIKCYFICKKLHMTVLLRFLMAIFICTLDITAINIRVWFNNVNLSCIVKKFCVIVILYSLVVCFRWDYGTRNYLITNLLRGYIWLRHPLST